MCLARLRAVLALPGGLPGVAAWRLVLLSLMGLAWMSACSPSSHKGGDAASGAADTAQEIAEPDVPLDAVEVNPGPPLTRLRADGTRMVDAAGDEVVLRGVNLGGWMFHETWITLVDYPLHGRIYLLAQQEGILEPVAAAMHDAGMVYGEDPAVIRVCPANGDDWLELFVPRLKERLGDEDAQLFLGKVAQLPTALCDDSDHPLRAALEQRFGADGRDELLDSFQQAWIQEKDIAWLAQQGFNVGRVPIGYRNLMTGPDQTFPDSLQWNEKALTRLDDLLDWCAKHRVYAVVDIQEAPGGQNTYAGESGLYDNPVMQDLTVEMWETLSQRFVDRDEVAAYSLLAEPYGAPTTQARDEMYDRLVKAIRAQGDDHLLVIHDGFFGMHTLPLPQDLGWDNVVYSTHQFEWGATGIEAYDLLLMIFDEQYKVSQDAQGVPWYIGSFSTVHDEGWAYEAAGKLVAWYNQRGWSWSLWTYKRLDDPITLELFEYSTAWGLRGRGDTWPQRPDIWLDSKETLQAKFAAYADIEVAPNQSLLNMLLFPPPAR